MNDQVTYDSGQLSGKYKLFQLADVAHIIVVANSGRNCCETDVVLSDNRRIQRVKVQNYDNGVVKTWRWINNSTTSVLFMLLVLVLVVWYHERKLEKVREQQCLDTHGSASRQDVLQLEVRQIRYFHAQLQIVQHARDLHSRQLLSDKFRNELVIKIRQVIVLVYYEVIRSDPKLSLIRNKHRKRVINAGLLGIRRKLLNYLFQVRAYSSLEKLVRNSGCVSILV